MIELANGTIISRTLANTGGRKAKQRQVSLTGPTFCTTVSERVYITTSLDRGASGGSQGAVGDRRAAICGANAVGTGGL